MSDSDEQGSVNSLVSEILIHDEWNSTSWRFHADIAILVMVDPVKFSDTIKPICLPPFSSNEVSGVGTVVGWGLTEHSGFKHFENIPSEVDIPTVGGYECLLTFPKLAEHASTDTFCGGFKNKGKAPCLGDSGGGFYLRSSSTSVWYVAGIVSGSLADPNTLHKCDINKFQLYTNVARFHDWISKVMKDTREFEWKYVNFTCSGTT